MGQDKTLKIKAQKLQSEDRSLDPILILNKKQMKKQLKIFTETQPNN
jgi:hypothetical protein